MVDHIGFILGQEDNHRVTLLTVAKRGRSVDKRPEEVLSKSRELLAASGFSTDKIDTKVIRNGSPSKDILKEASAGDFAAVAPGRTGTGKELLKKVFVGSVSNTLFHEHEGAALWLA